ncbi:MAG: hypothetical protein ABIS84_11810 [Arachnia sp.]
MELPRTPSMGTKPIGYLSGPAGMVTAMRVLLSTAGVQDGDIRTEEFTGC